MKNHKGAAAVLAILVLIVLAGLVLWLAQCAYQVQIIAEEYAESPKELASLDRGFYTQSGYVISAFPQDFLSIVAVPEEKASPHLEMLQINLRTFMESELTDAALENIDTLFQAYARKNCRLIVRILYDWSGRAADFEPKSIEIIRRHMQRLGPVLSKHKDIIYTLQGLFIGNWGEMNGTPFVNQEDLQTLSGELLQATEQELYFSVRMPMYWRWITELPEMNADALQNNPAAARIGLYNDGMLGSESDWGTYGVGESRKADPNTYWNREEELAFQDVLCKYVPNGGEVISDNPYNDFENAVRDLRTMHISYLNWDYDREVLEKWERSTYFGGDCYDGMNGLEYIERHLGYRFYIDSPAVSYSYLKNELTLGAMMKNSGFAPVYSHKELYVTLCGREQTIRMECSQDLRTLTGGNQSDEALFFGISVPTAELTETEYDVYIEIWDLVNKQRILLANEQDPGELGYFLGTVSFARAPGYETVRGLFRE